MVLYHLHCPSTLRVYRGLVHHTPGTTGNRNGFCIADTSNTTSTSYCCTGRTYVDSNTRTAVVRLFVVRCTWQLYSMSCRWLFLFLLHNNRPMQTTVACLEPYWPQLQLYNKQYVRVRCNAAGCLVRRQPRSGTRAS